MAWGLSMATPMVAPAPTGASDTRITHTTQEPPQAIAEDTDKSAEPGRATPSEITVGIAALAVSAAGAAVDYASVLTNNAAPQCNAPAAATYFNSPAALTTYETTLPPGCPSDGIDSGHIETAADFQAGLREFTTLYDSEDTEQRTMA